MIRLGVDFGGTKIEAAAIDMNGAFVARYRAPTPGDYHAALESIHDLVARIEQQAGPVEQIGVGAPGSISPKTGLIRNANTAYLNGKRFANDLSCALSKQVRVSNDANCLAASESFDGAGADASTVFAVIIGTGCGGALAINGHVIDGANGIAGEWGHNPLPWSNESELPAPLCWCGQRGCLETWISGSGFQRDFRATSGVARAGSDIIDAMRMCDPQALATFERFIDRLARALATVVNIVDPDVFVFGGGMANVGEIYSRLSSRISGYVFADDWHASLRQAKWGDSSGVRGAARLWG